MIKTLPITYILKNMLGVFFSAKKNRRVDHGMCIAGMFFTVVKRSGGGT